MFRIAFILVLIAGIFASLITFPSGVTWMLAGWVMAALSNTYRRRSAWWVLLLCVLIFVVKQTGYTIEWFIVVFSFLVVAIADWRTRNAITLKNVQQRKTLIYAAILAGSIIVFGAMRFRAANTSNQVNSDQRPIVCLGDSLTDYGYPEELKKRLTVPVADFGFDGITTQDGIDLIPKILAINPQAVVIELGGHDYNSGTTTRADLRANLVKLIETFVGNDIAVILVEIPRGFISDPFSGLERELAAKYDLQLIDDSVIRTFVFFSPVVPPGMWMDKSDHYSNDGLHPNDNGNELFAEAVANALVKKFGVAIKRDQ